MIDQNVLNAFLMMLIGGVSGLLGSAALSWRRKSEATAFVQTTEATSDAQLVAAILKLAEGMNENNKQAGVERQQTLLAIERSGGRTEGMMAAIVDSTKAVKEMGLTLDEFGGRLQHIPQMKEDVGAIKASTAALSSLETNLGESFSEQFIPVVNALRAVEQAVQALTKELGGRDKTIFEGLRNLEGLFREAKLEFMRRISPDVEKHIPELLPKDTPDALNGNTANPQELPVNIQITSASKESK